MTGEQKNGGGGFLPLWILGLKRLDLGAFTT